MDQQNEDNNGSGGGNCSGKSSSGGFLCRQSSTRWTPTTDQIRILKDLYYNNGVRSPSADQIQRISARLRQYGKIEGKNVFYWFQNHKARERQKKRFTNDVPMQRSPLLPNGNGVTSPSPSGGVIGVGQMGNCGYGSVTMEKSFMDCSISGASRNIGSAPINHNMNWIGMDSYSSQQTLFEKGKSQNGKPLEIDQQDEQPPPPPELETLSLFPMHGEEINGFCNFRPSSYFSGGWYRSSDDNNGGSRTSLELSLNSYNGRSPGSMM